MTPRAELSALSSGNESRHQQIWTSPLRAGALLALSFFGVLLFGHDALSLALVASAPVSSFWLLSAPAVYHLAALPLLGGVLLLLAPTVALAHIVWWLIDHLANPTPQAALARNALTVWENGTPREIAWDRLRRVSFGPLLAVVETSAEGAGKGATPGYPPRRIVLPIFLAEGGRSALRGAVAERGITASTKKGRR